MPNDEPPWNDPAWLVTGDGPWKRGLRWQQGWWRQNRLSDEPAGPHYLTQPEGLVVSMLQDRGLQPNLMSDEAIRSVEDALRRLAQRPRPPGLIDEDRLKRNLLSSQPMCFNLFGHLGEHPEALLRWVRTLAPLAKKVVCTALEFAPSTGTIAGSAFDAFIEFERHGGGTGFLGVECKYAEEQSKGIREPAGEKFKVATKQGPWLDGAADALDKKHLRQFWYNQLLAQIAAEVGGYAEFVGVVVACEADAEARGARREVCARLKPWHRGTLKFSSIEDVVESVALPGDWEKRFTERYLDFTPIRKQLPPEDPRRLALPH